MCDNNNTYLCRYFHPLKINKTNKYEKKTVRTNIYSKITHYIRLTYKLEHHHYSSPHLNLNSNFLTLEKFPITLFRVPPERK